MNKNSKIIIIVIVGIILLTSISNQSNVQSQAFVNPNICSSVGKGSLLYTSDIASQCIAKGCYNSQKYQFDLGQDLVRAALIGATTNLGLCTAASIAIPGAGLWTCISEDNVASPISTAFNIRLFSVGTGLSLSALLREKSLLLDTKCISCFDVGDVTSNPSLCCTGKAAALDQSFVGTLWSGKSYVCEPQVTNLGGGNAAANENMICSLGRPLVGTFGDCNTGGWVIIGGAIALLFAVFFMFKS